MFGALWYVAGGAANGGILVRRGRDTGSEQDPERLATGAIVAELEHVSGSCRLHYEKVAGSGPQSGWVTTQLKGNDLLVKGSFWEVAGGGKAGGIVVREGQETSSPETVERLSTGSVIHEIALIGERLHYQRLSGNGPMSGWVSTKFRDSQLVVKLSAPSKEPEIAHPMSAAGCKARVLALHGAASNSNIMQFQIAPLKKIAGKEFEWTFLDGPCVWEPVPGATAMNLTERTPVEKMLAKDKPFSQWYSHPPETEHKELTFENAVYLEVEESLEFLDEFLNRIGGFDVVVAFSQSATLLALYMHSLRSQGREVPWRLNVLLCGAMIDDTKYQFSEPLLTPTLYVYGGEKDPWGKHGERCLPQMYKHLTMLEHEDGHAFPTNNPRAAEIYQEIARHMREVAFPAVS